MKLTSVVILSVVPFLVLGCKSGTNQAAKGQPALISSTEPHSVTNIYYVIDKGPGRAIYIPESAYEFMHGTGGTKVAIVNGQFPPPPEMPNVPQIAQTLPTLDLIDTRTQPPVDLK